MFLVWRSSFEAVALPDFAVGTYFVVIDKLQRAKAVDPTVADKANELISTYARYTPKAEDLFMLGIKAGDRVTVGGWIGESTTVR